MEFRPNFTAGVDANSFLPSPPIRQLLVGSQKRNGSLLGQIAAAGQIETLLLLDRAVNAACVKPRGID